MNSKRHPLRTASRSFRNGFRRIRAFFPLTPWEKKLRRQQQKLVNLSEAHRQLAEEAAALRTHLDKIDTDNETLHASTETLRASTVSFLFKLVHDRLPTPAESVRFCEDLAHGGTIEALFLMLQRMAGHETGQNFADLAQRMASKSVPFPRQILDENSSFFPITIIDVGAQNLSFQDHVYAPLLNEGNCRVTGFEPLAAEAQRRTEADSTIVMLPYFVGNGERAVFHINAMNATSSLYASNPRMLERFKGLAIVCRTVETQDVSTRRIDDISEVGACDYLKIDVQGGELDVLLGAPELLKRVSWVHLETEFDHVYLDQPLFSDIDRLLRAAGFDLIDLLDRGYDSYDVGVDGPGSRLLWADAVYMRRDDQLTPAQLLQSAYIAHVNYRKYDLAAYLIKRHDDATGRNDLPNYLKVVNAS